MAQALARRKQHIWPSLADEFESAANLALVEAASAFDPDRQVRFTTFARRRIQGALRDVQRRARLRGCRSRFRTQPGIEPLPETPADEVRKFGHLEQVPVGHDLEISDELEFYFSRLPAPYANACRELYLHHHSVPEAARAIGCNQVSVHRLHRKALTMLGIRDEEVMDN
jgi:RNA polymerase sigma factor (sigma-70 family)